VAILGGIWLGSALAMAVLPFVSYGVCRRLGERAEPGSPMVALAEIGPSDWARARLDAAGSLLFWVGLVALTPVELVAIAPAYAAFAFTWSSLQWVYHLRTPLDPIEGAYDLRLPTPLRWVFLNFNYNLQHHRHPKRPWQDLHAGADPAETQPLWYRYLQIFRPPEPLPADLTRLDKRYF
jgi:fatty acid desaturase